ncbi:MAG: hypothetical protein JWL90_4108 [Chthoniobacteraceae bacterium]|jgi:hypothetical protein|nr:hypothetical protein [Chthoniobacteraceae bacterium]MDB6175390.1 hypothetical protein [Chthoniobacteraceae bacterium]
MELTSEQKQQVGSWLEQGANLAEVQLRLSKEFGIGLTYMDTRFLIDDLRLNFKEPEPEPVQEPAVVNAEFDTIAPEAFPPAGSGVNIKVDSITRPGSMVSGSVVFSDGKKAVWYLDQTGSLGMIPEEPGYRPPSADVPEFQAGLERELVKLGI